MMHKQISQADFFKKSIVLALLAIKLCNSGQGGNITLGVLICLDVVSIKTLDLDAKKGPVSTIEKISTVSKS
jgi:hypothetical protein